MHPVLEQFQKTRIVPVIAIDDPAKAVPLVTAMSKGGVPIAEITFRTAAGEEAIRRVAKECPDIVVGAGTVLTCEQVDKAIAAGAQFIVSPGFNPKVVDYCLQKGILITPGVVTPSEMEQAIERGLNVVKFFPAEPAGGLNYLKAVSAPYPMLKFMPTGGVGPKNLKEYLAFAKILACGGSWMATKALIGEAKWDEITALCQEATDLVVSM